MSPESETMENLRVRISDNPKEFETLSGLLRSQDEFKLDRPDYAKKNKLIRQERRYGIIRKSFSLIYVLGRTAMNCSRVSLLIAL